MTGKTSLLPSDFYVYTGLNYLLCFVFSLFVNSTRGFVYTVGGGSRWM